MENAFKTICQFINDLTQLEHNITKNKMSYGEVKTLMELVDVKRKGFLDLGDIYDLVGKVSED